jgi:hypothetical protein
VRPLGQTEGGTFAAGTVFNPLNSGTRSADTLDFLGWFVGTENVPVPGDNVNDLTANFIAYDDPQVFTMPARNERLTALWGCEDGYVGGRFMLTIDNLPTYYVDGDEEYPAGQMESGYRSAGQTISLVSGTRDDGLAFLGWWIGTANMPEIGEDTDDLIGNPNFIAPTAPQTFLMLANDETLTALWGIGTIIGGDNLIIGNLPDFDELPTGQTETQSVPMNPGTIVLVHGVPTEGDWTFLGWVRGDELPDLYSNIDDFTGTVFPAGHTADVRNGRVTYTAIWGNEEGYVGIPNHNLVVNNLPAFAERPTGQT